MAGGQGGRGSGGNHGSASAATAAHARSIEKMLEDAQYSGEINLNNRRLKEYPKVAARYDLTDTCSADLSKNRFLEVPTEICELSSLEKLNLQHNGLRSVPETIYNLQALIYLNLNCNYLCNIPPCVCQLQSLEILHVNNNKLVSLPEEIGKLECLMDLDVSCNEISHLPSQIGDLENLRSLNLRKNILVELPKEICNLNLLKLDISCNQISSIHCEYKKIEMIRDLVFDFNPLTSPPAHICRKGRIHVMKYLQNEASKEDKKRGFINDIEMRKSFRKSVQIPDSDELYFANSSDKRRTLTFDPSYNPMDDQPEPLTPKAQGSGPNSDILAAKLEQAKLEEEALQAEREREERRRITLRVQEEQKALREKQNVVYRRSPEKSGQVPKNTVREDSLRKTVTSQGAPPEEEFRRPHKVTQPQGGSSFANSAGGQVAPSNRFSAPDNSRNYARERIPSGTSASTGSLPRPGAVLTQRTRDALEEMRGDLESAGAGCRFTYRRQMEQERIEQEQMQQLKQSIETRLKVTLPDDLHGALKDGVVLCHLANNVRPRSVSSIHVPSPAVPKLTLAKSRKNIENFLEACRKIGVDERYLCGSAVVLEKSGLPQLAVTIRALLKKGSGN